MTGLWPLAAYVICVGALFVRVADPAFNGEQTIALMGKAAERNAAIVLFPELGLPGYSCEDLHQQRAVLAHDILVPQDLRQHQPCGNAHADGNAEHPGRAEQVRRAVHILQQKPDGDEVEEDTEGA